MSDMVLADVILAETGGHAWLVRGEEHIDHLLANTLPAHVSIEVVTCESKSAIDALWRAYGATTDEDMMWLVHPAIVNRARGGGGESSLSVVFAEWSASLDERAVAALAAAADVLLGRPGCVLALVRHAVEGAPAMAADLGALRLGLIEARLAGFGVEADRVVRDVQDAAEAALADRVELVVREA